MDYTLYIDESGYTGANWSDKNQPIFVFGGVFINDCKKDKLRKDFEKTFSFQGEFKSSNYFYEENHYIKANEFIYRWLQKGLVPFFVVSEKVFLLGAKLIEFFFDPLYNSKIDVSITYPNEFKKALANKVYESKDCMDLFHKMINENQFTLDNLKILNSYLVNNVFQNNHMVIKMLKGLNDDSYYKMIDEYRTVLDDYPLHMSFGLHLPSSVLVFHKVDTFFDKFKKSGDNLKVVCDNTENAIAMNDYIKVQKESKSRFNLINDSGTVYFGIENIMNVSFQNSMNNAGLQVADFVVGLIRKMYYKLLIGKKIYESEKEVIAKMNYTGALAESFDTNISHKLRCDFYQLYNTRYDYNIDENINNEVSKYSINI